MLISDRIARLIETLIEESGGTIELKRNDMAQQLGFAPSQINYVITSRFTPERGYMIESRRGGGGYVRIVRRTVSRDDYLSELALAIGDSCDEALAFSVLDALERQGLITPKDAYTMKALLSRQTLSPAGNAETANYVRASLLSRFILCLSQA